jgi:phytoene dehydrogenase-like protein
VAGRYDAVIIRAGHHGLVCACNLIAAGIGVKMLKQRSVVGEATVMEEAKNVQKRGAVKHW